MSARRNLYDYIKSHGCRKYTFDELREVGKISEWARVLRQLNQDDIISYKYDSSSREYEITDINPYSKVSKRSGLTAKTKARIRKRDGYRCQACGRSVNDDVVLHIDHKVPLAWGGTNLDDNLWTLCDECNQGKKDFFKEDFDPKVMILVNQERSGYQKLKVLFENSPGVKYPPAILQGISGIRDWTRTIRNIRTKYNMNIPWFPPTEEDPNGYYMNVKNED
ncbi:MAG: HNH endonuclease [Fluviicola sp.]